MSVTAHNHLIRLSTSIKLDEILDEKQRKDFFILYTKSVFLIIRLLYGSVSFKYQEIFNCLSQFFMANASL